MPPKQQKVTPLMRLQPKKQPKIANQNLNQQEAEPDNDDSEYQHEVLLIPNNPRESKNITQYDYLQRKNTKQTNQLNN